MLEGVCDGLIFLWDTYITSYEGIATVVIILIMLLKVLINQKASALHFKKMIVSFPSEIVFLVMGFLLADIISISKVEHNENSIIASIMAGIIIALIILVIQYALERWLDDKLSGKLELGILVVIILMYVLSIAFYIFIIFGGVYNG